MKINIGLDSWSQLSKRNTKNLGISEKESNNRFKAQQQLGDNMTDDEYQVWKDTQHTNEEEDLQQYNDRDILEDDD